MQRGWPAAPEEMVMDNGTIAAVVFLLSVAVAVAMRAQGSRAPR